MRALASVFSGAAGRALIAAPLAGPLLVKADAARYVRTLSLLLSAGYALVRAEPVARATVRLDIVRARLEAAAGEVREGRGFADALMRHKALPGEMLRLAELGETSGKLSLMLMRAGELAERDVRLALKRTGELIGPAMIAILGIAVGLIIAAVMSGVLSLNEVVY